MAAPLLQIENLSCERDDRLLIENLSFTVREGEVVQLEGPNGSGKTTLLRILCGLSTRFDGEILWRGGPLRERRRDFLGETLYLGHGPAIKSVLTPRENLHWLAALRGDARDPSTLEAALACVGLEDYADSPCHMLSAGQQRRVGLARLFVCRARLWILDEPFTAIDRHGVAELEQWIGEHAQRGGAVLLTTHHALRLPVPPQRIRLGELR